MGNSFTFHKLEKLAHKPSIDAIFQKKGQAIFNPPILFIYLKRELQTPFPCQVLVSVGKKKFKRAVDRNRIKRQITNIYRLHKHRIYEKITDESKYAIGIIYLSEDQPDFAMLQNKIIKSIDEFIERI